MDGFDGLLDELKRVAGNAQSRSLIEEALTAAAEPVEQRIKENIITGRHERSGKMLAAVRVGKLEGHNRWRNAGQTYRIKVGVHGHEAPHAQLVEYGHGGPKPAPPHPFMRPAYEATKDEAMRIAMEKIKAALFEHGGDYEV